MSHDSLKPFNDIPLLPPLEDIETKSVFHALISAHSALGELKGFVNMLPNPKLFLDSIILMEAQSSSEIENIVTTQDELFRALFEDEHKVSRNVKEVLSYRRATYEGFDEVCQKGFISTNLMIRLQEIIKNDSFGLRKMPGTVISNAGTGEILYTPPVGEALIRDLLANLEQYLNSDNLHDPLIKMAVGHYQFESIHPFSDGNGRTGRLINVLYLVSKGYLEYPILYMSRYILENKARYYRLFREVREDKAWENWILFMLDCVEKTARRYLEQTHRIVGLIDETSRKIQESVPGIYSRELVECLFRQTYIRIENLVEAGIAKRMTASSYLRQLESMGILSSEKKGRSIIYTNEPLVRVLTGINEA